MTLIVILIAAFLVYKNRDRIKAMLSPSQPQAPQIPTMQPGPYRHGPGECPACHQPLREVTHP